MKRKYFFFDIDGTLTDRATHQPVDSALLALKKLQEAGHFVSLATGRAQYKARPFMEKAGLRNMVCAGGGALVFDDKLIRNVPLDLEKAREIAKQAEQLGYGILFALDDSIKVYAKNDLFIQQAGKRKEPTEYIFDPGLDIDSLKQIYKMYISIPQKQEHLLTSAKKLGRLRFVKDYLMFQYDEKKQGILDLLELAGGKPEDAVVFGDDTNDLVMFDPAWFSVAMGNATDELKARADYVTADSADDGIYKACEKFGWFEPVSQ